MASNVVTRNYVVKFEGAPAVYVRSSVEPIYEGCTLAFELAGQVIELNFWNKIQSVEEAL